MDVRFDMQTAMYDKSFTGCQTMDYLHSCIESVSSTFIQLMCLKYFKLIPSSVSMINLYKKEQKKSTPLKERKLIRNKPGDKINEGINDAKMKRKNTRKTDKGEINKKEKVGAMGVM